MRSLLFLLLWLPTGFVAAEPVYSVGVVPQQAAAQLARNWTPLLRYLQAQTGRSFRFKTAPDIPTFEKRLAAGEYDFAYMNPYHYAVFSDAPGYRALAKEKETFLQGIVVVKADGPITAVEQLQGLNLAFPAPAAFAASILPRMQLSAKGLTFTPHYVASHDSVYYSVAQGLYPAGGGIFRTFNNLPTAIRQRLRVIWETEHYTPHAFAVHPRVASEVSEQMLQALIALEAGTEVVSKLGIKGWQRADDADWNDIRQLPLANVQLGR